MNRSSTRVSKGAFRRIAHPHQDATALAMEVERRQRVDHQGPAVRYAEERARDEDDPGIGSSGSAMPAVAARRPAHGPAASTTVDAAIRPAVVETPIDPIRVPFDRLDGDAGQQLRARTSCRGPIAQGQSRWIGDPVLGAERRPDDPIGLDPRRDLRGRPGVEDPDVDPERALKVGGRLEVGPGRRVPDKEQVAVLDDIERQTVRVAEPDDERDAGQGQLDVHPARELVPEAARAAPGRAETERRLALEQHDPAGAGGGQVIGGTRTDGAAADHYDIGGPRQAVDRHAGGHRRTIVAGRRHVHWELRRPAPRTSEMPDPTTPYERPTDPAKRHSHALTDGPERAGARSMLKAVGFTDEDLAKPLVGVATTWIETMPCNLNQRRLAEHVKDGIRAAGGTPMEFNTISVSDGVSMGTEGMKASLVSREVVADSIELVVRGHLLDGVVCLVGCDKTIPGAAMALGRLDVPGVVLYNGTIYPGTYKGKRNATVVTVYEAIGAYRAGKISLDDLYEVENAACPGPGACGGQFTANTMSMVMEFLGLSPAGLNGIPAEDPGQGRRGPGDRRARHGPRPARRAAVVVRRSASARERHRRDRRDRRLDERRPPHAGDRPRVRARPRHRRVRGDRRPDADRRRPPARRAVHRDRHLRGRRGRARHARAAQARPPRWHRPDGRRPDDRRDRRGGRSRRRARRSSSRSSARSSRPADWRSSTAASRPRAAW